jgi:outer membrane protein TolC
MIISSMRSDPAVPTVPPAIDVVEASTSRKDIKASLAKLVIALKSKEKAEAEFEEITLQEVGEEGRE